MASAAIPIVFPPVRVASQAGDLWFGDGGLRLVHAAEPRDPARRLAHPEHRRALEPRRRRARARGGRRGAARGDGLPRLPCPPLAQVTGVFLNAIFLDHLDADLDHLARMNEIVASGQRDAPRARASRSDA